MLVARRYHRERKVCYLEKGTKLDGERAGADAAQVASRRKKVPGGVMLTTRVEPPVNLQYREALVRLEALESVSEKFAKVKV